MVRDVCRPELIWCDGIEVPLHEVRSGESVLVRAGGSLPPASQASLKPGSDAQSRATRFLEQRTPRELSKLGTHPRIAVGPSGPVMDLPYLFREGRISRLLFEGGRSFQS
jgi:hypothetical protein